MHQGFKSDASEEKKPLRDLKMYRGKKTIGYPFSIL